MYTRARILKSLKAKVLTAFASFALLLGVGAVVTVSESAPETKVNADHSASGSAMTVYLKIPNWDGTLNYPNAQYHNKSSGNWTWCYPSHPESLDPAFVYDGVEKQKVIPFTIPAGTDYFQFKFTQQGSGDKYTVYAYSDEASSVNQGYEYGGWNSGYSQFNLNKWTVYPYTVNYHANGGSGSMSSDDTFEHSNYTVKNNAFSRAGYTFQKWCGSPLGEGDDWFDEGDTYNRTSNSDADLDLYAVWIPDTMRFVWENKNSNNYIYLWNSTDYDSKKEIVWPGAAATGSFTANGKSFYYYDFIYSTQEWIPNRVIFHNNNGTQTGDLLVPVKSWDGEYYFGLSSATAESATMTQSIYSVEKNATNGSVTVAAYGTHGSSLSINWAPGGDAAYNYSFTSTKVYAGTDNTGALLATFTSGTSGTYTMTGKFLPQIFVETIYSKTIKQYEVTFNANGHGVAPSSQTVNHGGKVSKPSDPSATGYTFGGWYKEAGCTNAWNFSTDTVTAARTLYAKWTPNGFSVHYLPNGGSGSMADSSLTYDSAGTISANAFTKTGYTFAGWTLIADGDVFCTSGEITKVKVNELYPGSAGGTRNLYAKWTINSYNVTFNLQGHGSAIAPQTIDYGDTVEEPNDPSADGYTFGGWYKEAGCTNAWNFSTDTVTGATVLYAKWTANVYTITLNNEGATSAGTTAIYEQYGTGIFLEAELINEMSEEANPITLPVKDGYTFTGYFTSGGTKLIDEDGYITSDLTVRRFLANATLYAHWSANSYAVTIAAGTGASSVYLSTEDDATSGSASGTTFEFGTAVYGFVVLQAGYAHQGTWDLVSGTADTAGAIYCVGSLTVATSGNDFGTKTPISGETAAITYATNFNTQIGGVCKNDNTTDTGVLATRWATQKTNYGALAGYVKYWLDKTTHSTNTNVTNMLDKYDYVCGKYGTNGLNLLGSEPDFLNRKPSVPASPALVPGAPKGNESPLTITLWIVLGAGMLGLGAIGTAYFVSKKKKRTQVR